MDRVTDSRCLVCKDMIVERSHIPYIPKVPGSHNMATEENRKIDGYHCRSCGVEYHHLPKELK